MAITRRTFVKALAALISIPVLGKTGQEDQVKADKLKTYYLASTYVAGVSYYDFSDPSAINDLCVGAPLILKREPGNTYDGRAIEVFTKDGKKVGYIPRHLNRIPASLMDQGIDLKAKIVKLNAGDFPWRSIKIQLEMVS
ncbi:MAG: HIRAN domain-containing protein [Firmicutes bacterium]|nr:HIRAN domain-containing protein [Bacillota bacterium]